MKCVRINVLAFFFLTGAVFDVAHAACWQDEGLSALARQVAQQRFPLTAQHMPAVVRCSADEFAPNVGGDYTSGIHRIRVPVWLKPSQLELVVAHELGHAEVALSGAERGADGHGPGWVAVMERAGLAHEVKRVALHSPVAAAVLAQRGQPSGGAQLGQAAQAGGQGYLPGRPVVRHGHAGTREANPTCRQIMVPVYEPGVIQVQPRKVCSPR